MQHSTFECIFSATFFLGAYFRKVFLTLPGCLLGVSWVSSGCLTLLKSKNTVRHQSFMLGEYQKLVSALSSHQDQYQTQMGSRWNMNLLQDVPPWTTEDVPVLYVIPCI